MRSRAPALVTVVVFAVVVAIVAVLAGREDGQRLVKLPAGAIGGDVADESAAAGVASARSAVPSSGAVEYRVEGALPRLPSTAPGHRLGSSTTAAGVGRLAAALGLEGDAQADGDGWVVRSGDRELRVQNYPGLPWYLSAACPDTPLSSEAEKPVTSCAVAVDLAAPVEAGGWSAFGGGSAGACPAGGCPATDPVPTVPPACPDGAACPVTAEPQGEPDPACSPDVGCAAPPTPICGPEGCVEPVPAPAPVEPPPRPSGLPSEHDAGVVAREAFTRLGVGTEGLVVEDGWVAWQARVESKVDGLRVIGLGTSLSIGVKGQIVGGNGFLAVPERIGDYPLIGVEAGLKRLSTGSGLARAEARRTLDAPASAVATKDGTEPAPAECDAATTSCLTVAPEGPPIVETVTGAHLGLLQTHDALVPAYVFELAGRGIVPVAAVTDEWLEHEATTRGR